MITFKEFLNENMEVQEAQEFFHKEALPFIQQAKGHGVFLRGSDRRPPTYAKIKLPSGKEIDVGITTVRKDRRPMNASIEFHNAVDTWMKETFGIAGRSGSAFVLGASKQAIELANFYGKHVYAVIPQGDFKFLWSPKVEDLFDQYYNGKIIDNVKGLSGDKFTNAVRLELEKLKYQNTDLIGALSSKNEVMIECNHLLVIDITHDTQNILNELMEILK